MPITPYHCPLGSQRYTRNHGCQQIVVRYYGLGLPFNLNGRVFGATVGGLDGWKCGTVGMVAELEAKDGCWGSRCGLEEREWSFEMRLRLRRLSVCPRAVEGRFHVNSQDQVVEVEVKVVIVDRRRNLGL